MRYAFFAAAVLLAATQVQPAVAQGHHDLIARAVAAVGGEHALRGLKSVLMKGKSTHWEPDQSMVSGGGARVIGDSEFTVTWDLAKGEARTDWQREMKYPSARKLKYSEILTPKFGFVLDDEGSHAMSGIRVATQLREMTRLSPLLLLSLHNHLAKVAGEGGIRVHDALMPAVSFTEGGVKFWVMFDRKTNLPAVIRTHDDDAVRGTAIFDVRLDDWKPVGGVLVAHRLTYTLGDTVVARMLYTSITPNYTIDPAAFAPSEAVKAALKGPATGVVPHQWVLRGIFGGMFLDSDQVFVPPGGGLKLVELAHNVQQVVGGTHNSLIVAMKDGLVVFDAPVNEGQSRWTIDAARAKYGKPVKYLVLTHHHADHTSGVRTYMAEGAKIIVPAPDRKYFAKIALTQHVIPDELEKKRISADIVEVKDDMTLKDDGGEIRIYRIANPHVDGMLIGHVVADNILWESDLWAPGGETRKNASVAALSDAIKKIGITSATIAGGHGGTATQSELEKIAGGE